MTEQDRTPPADRPQRATEREHPHIDGSEMSLSSSESGGNYDWAGPTSANVEGEPATEGEEDDPTAGREEEQR